MLGHGSTLNQQSASPARWQADELRRRGRFREVHAAFWKQEPRIQTVLPALTAPRVFIVPLFVSEGYFSTEIIPRELGFRYPDQLMVQTPVSCRWYCHPVGTHPGMTGVILARAAGVVAAFPFPHAPPPSDVSLFIAGHGTERNKFSRRVVERQAELIRQLGRYAAVGPVFMEEAPRISDCLARAATRSVVVAPFFMSDGLHAVEDIPVLLGEPADVVRERLAAGQPAWRNPTEKHGRRVWYAAAVGTDPLVADVILERVSEAARSAPPARLELGELCHPG